MDDSVHICPIVRWRAPTRNDKENEQNRGNTHMTEEIQ